MLRSRLPLPHWLSIGLTASRGYMVHNIISGKLTRFRLHLIHLGGTSLVRSAIAVKLIEVLGLHLET